MRQARAEGNISEAIKSTICSSHYCKTSHCAMGGDCIKEHGFDVLLRYVVFEPRDSASKAFGLRIAWSTE